MPSRARSGQYIYEVDVVPGPLRFDHAFRVATLFSTVLEGLRFDF